MAPLDQKFLRALKRRDVRALARAVTLLESDPRFARECMREFYPRGGKAQVVGITGSPGAGKSTLVDALAGAWRAQGRRVAILAIDPSSPFSGGAILGDRIRMVQSEEDGEIFIRSMATRGSLGGISRATFDVVQLLDGVGFDLILVETVGVGQAEVDVIRVAQTCVVVVVPGMGDTVQAFKAGILEIADIFVINKAERDGADVLARDLRLLLSLGNYAGGDWEPALCKTVATKGSGVEQLLAAVDRHREWWENRSEKAIARERAMVEGVVTGITASSILERVALAPRGRFDRLVSRVITRSLDPYSAARALERSA